MGVTALWTAVRNAIPLLVVIANNRSFFNDELHQERVARERGRPVENRWIGQSIRDPDIDLATMARGQGCVGIGPVEDPKQLVAAMPKRSPRCAPARSASSMSASPSATTPAVPPASCSASQRRYRMPTCRTKLRIRRELRVGRVEEGGLGDRLGDQHPVEGISMQEGQFGDENSGARAERQIGVAGSRRPNSQRSPRGQKGKSARPSRRLIAISQMLTALNEHGSSAALSMVVEVASSSRCGSD